MKRGDDDEERNEATEVGGIDISRDEEKYRKWSREAEE